MVSNESANVTLAGGEVVPGAGEMLVYRNTTGKLVRRLRSPTPFYGSNFGRVFAASGDLLLVTDGDFTLRAFNLATGASLWRANFITFGVPENIKGVATDGDQVAVRLFNQSFIDTRILDAKSGVLIRTVQEAIDTDNNDGAAVAISGLWTAVGVPSAVVSGRSSAGLVLLKHAHSPSPQILNSPEPAAFQSFGYAVAISDNSLYVGCGGQSKVYHFDLRTRALVETIQSASLFFGQGLSVSGHLLLIHSKDGPYLFDRQTGNLELLFSEISAPSGTKSSMGGLFGSLVVSPIDDQLYRSVGVGGGRLDLSIAGVTNRSAAGVTGAKFQGFSDVALNAAGNPLFAARMIGSGITAANDNGIWSGPAATGNLLLREGSTVGSTKVTSPFRPFYSHDGTVSYAFTRQANGTLGLWRQNGGSLSSFAMPGDSIFLQGLSGALPIANVHGASALSTNGAVVNLSLKTPNGVSLTNDNVISRPGLLSTIEAREGAPSGLTDALHGQFSPRIASSQSHMAFTSMLTNRPTTANAAAFMKVSGGAKVVVLEKGQAPVGTAGQFPDAKISSIIGESVSDAVTLVRATYKTAAFTADGLWSYNHGTTAQHSVAWVRGQVPDFASGVTWKRLLKAFVTTDGTTLFLAQIGGKGINSANDVGFWRCPLGSNAPTPLVLEEQVLSGTGGVTIASIQQVDASLDGSWTLLTRLGKCPASGNQALLGGNITVDSGFTVVARKGLVMDRLPAPSPLLSISLSPTQTDASGMGTLGKSRSVHTSSILRKEVFKDATELVVTGIWGY